MRRDVWEEMLRRIPPQYHENLLVATVTGAEIVLQSIVRIDGEVLILRGRPSGTLDAGLIILLPFSQINYVGFQRRLTEQEVQSIFGDKDTGFAADAAAAEPAPEPGPEPGPAPTANGSGPAPPRPNGPQPPAAAPRPNGAGPGVSKSVLLAKLRERLNGEGGQR